MSADTPLSPRLSVPLIAVVTLTLSLGAPAVADDQNGHHEAAQEQDHDHAHDPLSTTPFVVDGDDAVVGPLPEEPMGYAGPAPDPGDVPAGWQVELPATEIDPTETLPSKPAKGGSADAGPSASAVPSPPSKSLPSTLDASPGFQTSYTCDPNDKPGAVAFAELVSDHYDRSRYGTSRACEAGNSSQHAEGRAVDWMMNVYNPSDKAIGDAVASWLTANDGEMARRFGIELVIWNKRIWGMYAPGEWRAYDGPSPHTDHLHFSFTWDGAMKRTSWWTGKAVTTIDYGPCRVYAGQYAPRYTGRNTTRCSTNLPTAPASKYPVTLPGARNSNVSIAQGYLGTSTDGIFGKGTLSTLLGYQDKHDLPRTGVLDNATWAFMDSAQTPSGSTAVSRISGDDRYEVAAGVASLYPTGGDVYVTTGEKYPDALAAGARAGSQGDPILLTRSGELPPSTIKELQRIKPRKIYIVGGPSSVNDAVYRALRGYAGSGGVTRLGGANRYEMAATVAGQFGSQPTVAYVATGENYPDALAAAARAGYNDAPVLLTQHTSLPSSTRAALKRLNPRRIVVVGNTSAVTTRVKNALVPYASGRSVERVSGSGTYGTSSSLASYYPSGGEVVYLATAERFPDALAGAARGATDSAPVLLTDPDFLPSATKTALAKLHPQRIVVLGGTESVSTAVERLLPAYVD